MWWFKMKEMKGEIRKPRKIPFRLTESGHKVFYDFKTFTYLQDRMVGGGLLDEIY